MMVALVIAADGFEELETIAVVDILRRADIYTLIVTIKDDANQVVGSNKLHLIPDAILRMEDGHLILQKTIKCEKSTTLETEKIAVVLPGGMKGMHAISRSAVALELIKRVYYSGESILGAICAAPMVLKEAGIVGKDIQLTAYPSFKEDLSELYTWRDDAPVIRSGSRSQLITRYSIDLKLFSRGPGTAIPFALALVEAIAGSEVMKRVATDGLFDSSLPGNLE